MSEDLVEFEEWYKNGRVVKRYINGVEVAPDDISTATQFCDTVVTKKYMTREEYKYRFTDSKLKQ